MVCSRLTPRVMPLMSSVMLSRFLATVSSVNRWPTVPSPSSMRPVILSTWRNDLSRLSMLVCSFCNELRRSWPAPETCPWVVPTSPLMASVISRALCRVTRTSSASERVIPCTVAAMSSMRPSRRSTITEFLSINWLALLAMSLTGPEVSSFTSARMSLRMGSVFAHRVHDVAHLHRLGHDLDLVALVQFAQGHALAIASATGEPGSISR